MTKEIWLKIAQSFVMFCAAVGIKIDEASALSIVTGAFAFLSALSALKAWVEKKKMKE